MARRRFQDPKPFRRGEWWCLLYWQDHLVGGTSQRKRKWAKLAPASAPEREVRKIAAELLRPMNQGLITVGSAVNFEDYVQSTYIPTVLPAGEDDTGLLPGRTPQVPETVLRLVLPAGP